jgi:phospholipid transport system substrate-binding protein
MGRLLEYQNETVVFEKQTQMTDTRAEVQTHIVTATNQIPIHYRLILKDGQWKVYDLIIENVSLVKNYRSQFDSILSRQTPEELLDILRRKTAEPA